MSNAAVCEINKCGVLAIGRCAQCHKAFCGSHQGYVIIGGRNSEGTPLPDTCLTCTTNAKNALGKAQNLISSYEPALRKRIDLIAKKLAAANVPQESRRRRTGTEGGSFFSPLRHTYETLESAWYVGDYAWNYHGEGMQYAYAKEGVVFPTGVTATGALVIMNHGDEKYVYPTYDGEHPIDHDDLYRQSTLISQGQERTKELDQIRIALEGIAKKHKVKLESWHWPPQENAVNPTA